MSRVKKIDIRTDIMTETDFEEIDEILKGETIRFKNHVLRDLIDSGHYFYKDYKFLFE